MYNINKLKQLRKETGISFSLCKKALEQSDNDIAKAKKILNKWGAEKVRDKAFRSTSQGAIFAYVHHNKKVATLAELLCETDFVSGNTDFQKLGMEVAMQVASNPVTDVDELLNQEYIRDPSKKVVDLLKEATLKFGENIKINRFVRWTL